LELGEETGAQEPDSLVHAEHPDKRTGLAAQRRAVGLGEGERGTGGGSGKFEVVDIGKFPSPGETGPLQLLPARPKGARCGAARPTIRASPSCSKLANLQTCEGAVETSLRRARSSVTIAPFWLWHADGPDIWSLATKHWPRSHPIHRQLPRQTHVSFAVRASETFFTRFAKHNRWWRA
jgi:hypothetical protein